MEKIFFVLKNEFLSVVRRRSFLITLFVLPLGGFLVYMVVGAMQKGNDTITQPITALVAPAEADIPDGVVDHSRLVTFVPDEYKKSFRLFNSEAEATRALKAGEVKAYYVIGEDYMTSGEVTYYHPDFNPLNGMTGSGEIENLIERNLLKDNPALAERIRQPMKLESVILAEETRGDPESMVTFFLPYGVTMLFYFIILSSSSMMLNSITNEKQNRVIEILLTSCSPQQILTGKIIALGLVGLLQTAIWGGCGYGLMRLSGQEFNIPLAMELPASLLGWGVLFFLVGYAFYASQMAAIGALVPNLKEASQVSTVVIMPMVVPLMLISALINSPGGGLAIALSMIPFTSPVAMMTRMAAMDVPVWQILLSLALLGGAAYFTILSAAGLFRSQYLLSGQSVNIKTFLRLFLAKKSGG